MRKSRLRRRADHSSPPATSRKRGRPSKTSVANSASPRARSSAGRNSTAIWASASCGDAAAARREIFASKASSRISEFDKTILQEALRKKW